MCSIFESCFSWLHKHQLLASSITTSTTFQMLNSFTANRDLVEGSISFDFVKVYQCRWSFVCSDRSSLHPLDILFWISWQTTFLFIPGLFKFHSCANICQLNGTIPESAYFSSIFDHFSLSWSHHESPTLNFVKVPSNIRRCWCVFSAESDLAGKRIILQRRQPGWLLEQEEVAFSVALGRWMHTDVPLSGQKKEAKKVFSEGRRGEWQPYAGPLTHLPSWHTNPSHWFSAQRICSSAWPRMPLGHKMLSDFFVFFPETNTLTLDGCWRARALDEIENRVAPPFPIRIWQLLL